MRPAFATLALGTVLLLVAATFDTEPLYVPALALVALAAGSIVWVAGGARGLRVTREVGARSVQEDEPLRIRIAVAPGRFGVPTGLLHDPLLDAPVPLGAGRGRATRVRIEARLSRRGRRVLAPPWVEVADPLGLARRRVPGPEPTEVLVLPRVEPVVVAPGPGAGDALSPRRGRPRADAEVELDGLRPLRPGAPASRMYWPALARGGELLERRLGAGGDARPLVVLDPRGGAPEELDAAVRATASLAVHLARGGGCLVLVPGERRPVAVERGLAGWDRVHARLALVEATHPAPPLTEWAGRAGPLLLVGADPAARAPHGLTTGGGLRFHVLPGDTRAVPPAFRVAGCSGRAVGAGRRVGAASQRSAAATVTAPGGAEAGR